MQFPKYHPYPSRERLDSLYILDRERCIFEINSFGNQAYVFKNDPVFQQKVSDTNLLLIYHKNYDKYHGVKSNEI